MHLATTFLLLAGLLAAPLQAAETTPASPASPMPWRILIANDTCPDVTWGFTETQVRRAFADLIRAHLDEMNRTDSGPPEGRNHYNLMAFVEAEALFEQSPERRDEFIRRVREGRICLTPFLCNTLWGAQSVEGVIRSFYPAQRFAREHQLRLEVANHTELPSLPWGMATLLAGCGFRWTSVPFLDYDCTFKNLRNPPLFRLEGPDGSELRVILDRWASLKANYMQGGYLLQDTRRVGAEWVPHYEGLGPTYPLRTIYASGTHSDINPNSWKQARTFADGITAFNSANAAPTRLINGTLAQFCAEVDATEAAHPFLPKLRGCFGHSWELWPVSLANTVAAARENERAYLAAESLAAVAIQATPTFGARTRSDREHAEWCWAMLADHAWNGTDPGNQRHNAELRSRWASQLATLSQKITGQAWRELGLKPGSAHVTVFNPLSFTNDIMAFFEPPAGVIGVRGHPSTLETDELGTRRLRFVAPRVPPFGFREFRLETQPNPSTAIPPFAAGADSLEGPFYSLRVNLQNGGLARLVHKPSGHDITPGQPGRSLGQTVLNEIQERTLTNIQCRTRFDACTGEIIVTGAAGDLRVTNTITLYASLDRVDLDYRIEKPPTTNEQRLLQFFPITSAASDLRIETPAAVLRPCPQPEGDLLPGADPRRFAVQGFIDSSPSGRPGITVAPLDSYMLRLDQDAPGFEAFGNDQNWKEVTRDQDGNRHFRFRYSLRVHPEGYDQPAAIAWSRSVAAPVAAALGRLPGKWLDRPHLAVDPTRAIVTGFKPSDDAITGKAIVRLWETRGEAGPVPLEIEGYKRAHSTDLLEREQGALPLVRGRLAIPMRGLGLAAAALER